jgi:hypothetical protein
MNSLILEVLAYLAGFETFIVLKCEGGILEDRVGDFYILYIIST